MTYQVVLWWLPDQMSAVVILQCLSRLRTLLVPAILFISSWGELPNTAQNSAGTFAEAQQISIQGWKGFTKGALKQWRGL